MSIYSLTPLLRKEGHRIEGKNIWYKMDALQPTGSFKVRGMENAAKKAFERGCKRMLSSSGGNAGMAVAYKHRGRFSVLQIFSDNTETYACYPADLTDGTTRMQ